MSTLQPFGRLAGRLLLALIFIGSGFSKFGGFEATAASMASKGMPMVEVLLVGAILIELGGGLLLAVGYKARWAAPRDLPVPDPSDPDLSRLLGVDPDQAKMQLIQFQKNLAIMGGMLYVVFNGPGAISVDPGIERSRCEEPSQPELCQNEAHGNSGSSVRRPKHVSAAASRESCGD